MKHLGWNIKRQYQNHVDDQLGHPRLEIQEKVRLDFDRKLDAAEHMLRFPVHTHFYLISIETNSLLSS